MNKNEFKLKAKQTIDDLFHKIDELENKKDYAGDEAKETYRKKIKELKEKKKELEEKYDNVNKASEDKWEEAKEAFDKSAQQFKTGMENLTGLFKSK